MSVAEQRWEKRLSLVVVPRAGDGIDVAGVPGEIAEDKLCRRGLGDFCGFDGT